MNVFQAVIMGIAAFLIAVVCGNVLTYIIVFAINYQSFGWSIDIYRDPWVLVKTFALTISGLSSRFILSHIQAHEDSVRPVARRRLISQAHLNSGLECIKLWSRVHYKEAQP